MHFQIIVELDLLLLLLLLLLFKFSGNVWWPFKFCFSLIKCFPQECQSGTRLILIQEGSVNMIKPYKFVNTTKPRSTEFLWTTMNHVFPTVTTQH